MPTTTTTIPTPAGTPDEVVAPTRTPDVDPAEVLAQAGAHITTEYASLTRLGTPVTWPVTPYLGVERPTIDVATGLTYPLKAERARRDRRVALSFSYPVGSGLDDPATFVVQGLATVRDADLVETSRRYLQATTERFPEVLGRMPRPLMRRMAFYWARIWVEVTPTRVLWWPHGDLSQEPLTWVAPEGTDAPPSDPAPVGPAGSSWSGAAPADWRARSAGVLDRLGPPVLTSVGPDGWPLPVRVRSAEVTADGFRLVPAAGVEVADGPVALTFHTHAEVFDGQENVCLVGRAEARGDEVHVAVDRALNDWGVPRTPLRQAWSMLRARRQLSGRLEEAAARRGQAVPTYDELGL